jgi:signal transduction histidine kinase
VASLDEIVWAVNPRHDNLASLLEYLSQQAAELLQTAGIRCRLDFPITPAPRPLSGDFRHHVFLIAREALNNAVKYSGATEVRIRVETNGSLQFVIADNGRGIAENAVLSDGNGITNMRARARNLGGELKLTSEPGKGTTISLEVPWPAPTSESELHHPPA